MTSVLRVALVGAGPGDPGLLTLKGRSRLQQADIVFYDALVHREILKWVRPDAELVFVGKRKGGAYEVQERINALLIDAARAGKKVVRLKGGDPMIFGRAAEELEALHREGIAFEIVPGVTSPLAASAYAGIPLTHREHTSSLLFLTARQWEHAKSIDLARSVNAADTLVFFMGLSRLAELCLDLQQAGLSSKTPCAVIQEASLPSQKTYAGTLETLPSIASDASGPALIVIGSGVLQRESFNWFEKLPLFGKRVLVPRPRERADALIEMLRDAGADPIALPLVKMESPPDLAPLHRAIRECKSYDWLVFTSAAGVDAFFEQIDQLGLDHRIVGSPSISVIGPKTAERLLDFGYRADLIPAEYVGESVAQALIELVQNQGSSVQKTRILIPRALEAREALPDALRQAGFAVDVVPAYQNTENAEALRDLNEALERGEIDAAILTAPSIAKIFLRTLAEVLSRDAGVRRPTIVAIGPITAKACSELGFAPDAVAETYTAEGAFTSYLNLLCPPR